MNKEHQKFYKFYWECVLKKIWSIFFALSEFVAIFLFWFIDKIKTKIIAVGVMGVIGIILFIFGNFLALKKLFNKCKKKKNEGYNTGISNSYQNILDEIANKMPNLLLNINKKFDDAYKCLNKNNIKSMIIKHYIAYKPLKNELDKLYSASGKGIVITPKNSDVKIKLYDDYRRLKIWHKQIHDTNNDMPSLLEVTNLINSINSNFYTLLMEIQS